METPRGAVPLSQVLTILAGNAEVGEFLRTELEANECTAALAMLSAASLEGDLGNEVHNLLVDQILNAGRDVWSRLIETEAGEYPVRVCEWGGVYVVRSVDYEDQGYFGSEARAIAWIKWNWGELLTHQDKN